MKYLPLVWAALSRSRLRTALTFLSIMVAFLLFGVLHGVVGGLDELINSMSETRLRTVNLRGFTLTMPIALRDQIERISGVTDVAAYEYFGGYYLDPKNQLGGSAFDMAALFKIYPELVLPANERAAMLNTRTGALVGADLASRYGWKVGDRITVGTPIWQHPDGSRNWAFDIVGIYHFKSGAPPADQLWMNYDYFSEAGGQKGRASMFVVGIKDSASSDRISQEIDALFANSATPTLTQPERAWMQSRVRRTGNIRVVVDAILGAVLFTLLALTANTMMQSVRGRIREFAVLRTFGYSNGIIAVLVVLEAMLLCLAAAVCGLALAALAFPPVIQRLGLAGIPIPKSVIGIGFAIAVCLALVSALLPVWRALRYDVAAALATR